MPLVTSSLDKLPSMSLDHAEDENDYKKVFHEKNGDNEIKGELTDLPVNQL